MLRCTGRGTIKALTVIALIGFPALAFAQGTPEALPTISAVGSSDLPRDLALQCKGTDQPTAALITDLKQRGLLDDTLVVWGGEFGRTVFSQGKLTAANYGRDHHPNCFTFWLAGGGVKAGHSHGVTDDIGYHAVQDFVHVHDFHATMLHLLGFDHEKLTFRTAGRDFRLTDVHGHVVKELIA